MIEMKISINSDTAVLNTEVDIDILKIGYSHVFNAGFDGVDQSIPPVCEGSPLRSSDEFKRWAYSVEEAVSLTGGDFAQCHCPLITHAELDGFVHGKEEKRVYDDIFRAVGNWDCPMVVHPIDLPGFSDDSMLDEYLKINVSFFNMLLEYAEKYNVRIAAENLFDIPGAARHFCSKPQNLKYIIDNVNSPLVGACIDTGHALVSGIEPNVFLNTLGEKVFALHIHDNNGFSDQHNLPPFGNIDWKKFVETLKNINYTGYFNYEVHGEKVYDMPLSVGDAYLNYAYKFAVALTNCKKLDNRFK